MGIFSAGIIYIVCFWEEMDFVDNLELGKIYLN